MKGIIKIILWVSTLFTIHPTYSQDSIGVEDLRQFAYSFDIENNILTGEGAAVLTKAISNAHVVMLGSHSRSQLESDLDRARSRVLNHNGYNTLIMEIGPASAHVINRITNQQKDIVQSIKTLNQNYAFSAGDSRLTPIPDLKYEGTAKFVKDIKEKRWSIGAIGAEYWTGYKMIIDELYQNLLIDLSPFIETFYWGNYVQTLDMHNMMRSYDMIIIPKTDRKSKPNY